MPIVEYNMTPETFRKELKPLLKFYHGETENPYAIPGLTGEDRDINLLRFYLWDLEKAMYEDPRKVAEKISVHKYLMSSPSDFYHFAIGEKLDGLAAQNINLIALYQRII